MTSFDWIAEAESEWDKRASFWNQKSRDMWDHGSRKDIIPLLSNYLKPGSTILDIGCGDGYGSFNLYSEGYHVTGVDLSREMIQLAKSRLNKGEISFQQGNVNDIPFEDDSFDAIMAINVLEWVEDPFHALKELKRVVKPNGLICVGILGPTAGPRANSYPRLLGERAICNTMMPWEFNRMASDLMFNYVDGFGVYKEGVQLDNYKDLPLKLKQALTFMWVFLLREVGE